jgi:tetratricopeptide (TPR) repeat protein
MLTIGVYAVGFNPLPSGYADSDELATTSYLWGVSHPSGYALANIVYGAVMRLLWWLPSASVGNFLTMILMTVSMVILYLTLISIFSIFYSQDKNGRWQLLTAVTGALLTGVSGLIFLYASKIEVVSFTVFWSSLIVLLAVKWYAKVMTTQDHKSWLYTTAIITGIGLAHVHTVIFLLPPLLILLFLTRDRWSDVRKYEWIRLAGMGLLIAMLTFGIVNLGLFALNARQAEVSWAFPQTLEGWWGMVSRQDYAGYYIERDRNQHAYWHLPTWDYVVSAGYFLLFVADHFSWVGVGLFSIGVLALVMKRQPLAWFLLSLFVFQGILLGARMSYVPISTGPPQELDIGVMHRQFLAGEYMFGLIMAYGLGMMLRYLYRRFPKRADVLVLVITALIFSTAVAYGMPMGYQKDNQISHHYGRLVLEEVEENAVIICASDISCYTLLHQSVVEKIRPDVTILTKNEHIRKYFLETNPELSPGVYNDNPYFFTQLVAHNVAQGKPTYLTNIDAFYLDFIGLDSNPFFLIPKGLLFKVVTSPITDTPVSAPEELAERIIGMKSSKDDYWASGLRHYFADVYHMSGTLMSRLGKKNEARTSLEAAMNLHPSRPYTTQQLRDLPLYDGEESYKSQSATTAASLRLAADEYLSEGKLQEAYDMLRKATYLNPNNLELRMSLVELLLRGNFFREVQLEVDQILFLDPDYQPVATIQAQLKHLVE